ncbi:MAG: hydrogenase maturation protease [Jatrophihabitantaceae bacterium]
MTARILVAGVGNIFLGDDGFGCEVARRLAGQPQPDSVRIVDYGIRGMHLAYDLLEGYDALVIVDALPGAGQPGDITVLEVGPEDLGTGQFDAHGMDPVAVLANLENLGGELPRTLIVGCQPLDLEENIGLTPAVSAAVDVAVTTVVQLLEDLLGEHAVHVGSQGES